MASFCCAVLRSNERRSAVWPRLSRCIDSGRGQHRGAVPRSPSTVEVAEAARPADAPSLPKQRWRRAGAEHRVAAPESCDARVGSRRRSDIHRLPRLRPVETTGSTGPFDRGTRPPPGGGRSPGLPFGRRRHRGVARRSFRRVGARGWTRAKGKGRGRLLGGLSEPVGVDPKVRGSVLHRPKVVLDAALAARFPRARRSEDAVRQALEERGPCRSRFASTVGLPKESCGAPEGLAR